MKMLIYTVFNKQSDYIESLKNRLESSILSSIDYCNLTQSTGITHLHQKRCYVSDTTEKSSLFINYFALNITPRMCCDYSYCVEYNKTYFNSY